MGHDLHWTQQQYDDYVRRHNLPQRNSDSSPIVEIPKAKACRPKMTRAEQEYGLILQAEFPDSQILFEAYTLRLAHDCRYSPDWAVVHFDCSIDFYEVKGGYIFPKALVKPRAAAEKFPQHKFFLAQKVAQEWQVVLLKGPEK